LVTTVRANVTNGQAAAAAAAAATSTRVVNFSLDNLRQASRVEDWEDYALAAQQTVESSVPATETASCDKSLRAMAIKRSNTNSIPFQRLAHQCIVASKLIIFFFFFNSPLGTLVRWYVSTLVQAHRLPASNL
jgi:hypothetical protein